MVPVSQFFGLRLQPQGVFRVWFFSPLDHACHCQSRVSPRDLSCLKYGRKGNSQSLTRLEPTASYPSEELYPLIKIYQTHVEVGHFQSYYTALLGLAMPLFYQLWWTNTYPVGMGTNGSHRSYTRCTPPPYPAIPQSLSLKDHRKWIFNLMKE